MAQCGRSFPHQGQKMVFRFMGSKDDTVGYLLYWEQCPEEATVEWTCADKFKHHTCEKHSKDWGTKP
jgi:hypothetical protein